ncbi:hypothetical protein [Paenibacillus sp. NPDC058071]|uniref:hypothetical protein n=1 Tax=Paenibacillus sp. NPDC058071 TaxID=3346326 RepID=UPI0036DF4493
MHAAFRFTAIIGLFISFMIALPPKTAHAGFFDRVQDIYYAPEKLNEIEQQYKEANEALSQQLEQSRQHAESIARKQEELAESNSQLMEQNTSLQTELEQIKQEKAALKHKLVTAGIVMASLLLGYIAAIRIWRFLSWRRHRNLGERGVSG